MITPLSAHISAKISEFRPNSTGRQRFLEKESGVLSQMPLFSPNVTLFGAMFGSAPQKITFTKKSPTSAQDFRGVTHEHPFAERWDLEFRVHVSNTKSHLSAGCLLKNISSVYVFRAL